MRKKLKLMNVGYYEKGYNLIDEDGNFYCWETKTMQSPLVWVQHKWFLVTTEVLEVDFINTKRLYLKNVRIIKYVDQK